MKINSGVIAAAGSAAGVAAGMALLFAPQSGQSTRRQIGRNLRKGWGLLAGSAQADKRSARLTKHAAGTAKRRTTKSVKGR